MLARKILKTGPGIPLVFLHGFLGKSEDWEAVTSFLPPCECIAFDLPGHGNSPFLPDFDIDIPRFHLIGYSMGGRIALQFFAKKAETLTLLSVHPGLQTEEERKKRLENDQFWADLLLEVPIDEFLLRWYDQSIFIPFKPNLTMRKQQNIHDLRSALLQYSLAKQPRYEIEKVLIGEKDEKFKALYKEPTLIPNAGHMLHLENPQAVAEIIQKRISL